MITTAIEQSALQLSQQDRAHLVHVLLDSLDEPSTVDIQEQWLNLARHRAEEIDSGKVKLISGEAAEQHIQTMFR
jgi:putative addiction module component (TIGR02574 family)